MPLRRTRLAPAVVLITIITPVLAKAGDVDVVRNVIVVTTDGLRWQEVFRGAEERLLNTRGGGVPEKDLEPLRREFWRGSPAERREALLPFAWGVIAKQGQIHGNADKGSIVKVANGKYFSYPGYNELFTGFPDPRIDSNDKKPNPNVNILERLNAEPRYRGKIAAYCSWDVFPYILNEERSGLYVNAGWEPMPENGDARRKQINEAMLRAKALSKGGTRRDESTITAALEHLRAEKPRVFYVALDETDEDAHAGRYDRYLRAAKRADAFLKEIWETAQSMPEYRGTTTLIVTTDHGRGDPPQGWKSHGAKVPGAEHIWIGILGPDVPALGERSNAAPLTQSQVSSTIAAALGEPRLTATPQSAPAIADAIRPASPSTRRSQ